MAICENTGFDFGDLAIPIRVALGNGSIKSLTFAGDDALLVLKHNWNFDGRVTFFMRMHFAHRFVKNSPGSFVFEFDLNAWSIIPNDALVMNTAGKNNSTDDWNAQESG